MRRIQIAAYLFAKVPLLDLGRAKHRLFRDAVPNDSLAIRTILDDADPRQLDLGQAFDRDENGVVSLEDAVNLFPLGSELAFQVYRDASQVVSAGTVHQPLANPGWLNV